MTSHQPLTAALCLLLSALPAAAAPTIQVGPLLAPFPPDAGMAHVSDFDLTPLSDGFLLTWIGDNVLATQPISSRGVAGVTTQLLPVPTTFASSVASATLPDAGALLVGSAGGNVLGRMVGAIDPGPLAFGNGTTQPSYVAVAWNAGTALVAWTTYNNLFFRRVARDGTFLDAAAGQFAFPGSTFVPRVAVASDGTDWLIAVSASQTTLFRVTAAGLGSVVVAITQGSGGQHLALAHGPQGYVLATPTETVLFSNNGTQLSNAQLPPGPVGVATVDLATDGRYFLLARTRSDGLDGLLLGLDGVPVPSGAFVIENAPGTGEQCAVATGGNGTWLVTSGLWVSAWFATLRSRFVTVLLEPLGASCTANDGCNSGFCTDGVCCSSACGGGALDDCQVCGAGGACTVLPASSTCRPAAGLCDVAETCSGVSPACPSDVIAAPNTTCRVSAGVCDVVERCTGASPQCPADVVAPSTHVCRPAAGACDVPETCDGATGACPADLLSSAATVCRLGTCAADVAIAPAVCNGASPACPLEATTTCGLGLCSSGACQSPPDAGPGPGGGTSCTTAPALELLLLAGLLLRRRRR